MSKVVIKDDDMPPINIKGSEPVRLVRFRLISTTKNIKSQWSTIFNIYPVPYEYFTVVNSPSSNATKVPVNMSFNAVNNILTWGVNTFSGTVAVDSTNVTKITIGSHELRIGDEVVIESESLYSQQRDGVFDIVDKDATTITINLSKPVPITAGTGLTIQTKPPSNYFDVYIRFKLNTTVIKPWKYFGTFSANGATSVPLELMPTAGTANIIEVAFQRPTNPKKRYTVNDEGGNPTCPVVVCKMLVQYTQTVTR